MPETFAPAPAASSPSRPAVRRVRRAVSRAPSRVLWRTASAAAALLLGACSGVDAGSAGDDARGAARVGEAMDPALARDLALAAGERPLPDGDTALSTREVMTGVPADAAPARTSAATNTATTNTTAGEPPTATSTAPSVAAPVARARAPRRTPAPSGTVVAAAPAPSDAAADVSAPRADSASVDAPTAAPATTGSAPVLRILAAAGATATATTATDVCTDVSAGGDRLVARLATPLRSDGTTTDVDADGIPAGTPVLLEVVSADDGTLRLRLRSVADGDTLLAARGPVTIADDAVVERTVRTGGDPKRGAVVGAIAGAVLGRVLGGGKRGTVAGAAAGGAIGAASNAGERRERRCLPAGSTVRVTLDAPIVGATPERPR